MIIEIVIAVAGLLVVAVGGLAAYVASRPNDFRISRATEIAAPPAAVYAHVEDFHRWEHWSPWAKLDPNAKNTFAGPDAGEGAVFRWSGNNKVGEGAMTITEVKPNERIRLRLDFEKPMKDTSDTEFTFQPQGSGTVVTWTMSGRYQNFIGKTFCTLMNMDKMIGDKFVEGLASMKKIVEAKS